MTKKVRRWVLGEKNLPPESITESQYKVESFEDQTKISKVNQMKLNVVFEEWDDILSFGVCYKLLEMIFKQMNLIPNEKEQEQFRIMSGYYREANQLSASVSIKQFYEILDKAYDEAKKLDSSISEDRFVEDFLKFGSGFLEEVSRWEPEHYKLRREWGRQMSATRDDKYLEIVNSLKSNPSATVEEIEENLKRSGMSLSIIDKIYILKSMKDTLNIKIYRLLSAKKE